MNWLSVGYTLGKAVRAKTPVLLSSVEVYGIAQEWASKLLLEREEREEFTVGLMRGYISYQ